mmetsp:Transcript_32427/g.47307  ORF Transcript_32427/g.47307 Transcript_32427/m.47307 type:complete len:242 (-) Transcript_32427:256-981(-)
MRISRSLLRARSSGKGMYIRFWQRRRSAPSMAHGMLVAHSTSSLSTELPKPSIWTSNSVLIRRPDSESESEREVAIESISSMKMIDGLLSRASSKSVLTIFSLSPSHLEVRSAEETDRNVAAASVATALARKLLPVPGGPYSMMPLQGLRPEPSNNCGKLIGKITASFSASFACSRPAMSSHLTFGFSCTMAPSTASRILFLSLSPSEAFSAFLGLSSTGSSSIFLIFSARSMYSSANLLN